MTASSQRIVPFSASARLTALAAALVVLAAPSATAQTLCSTRNGTGVNPAGFACANDPLIGTFWNTTVDLSSTPATTSAVAIFFGGPTSLPTSIGEVLCVPPFVGNVDFAAGSHSIFVPNLTTILGKTYCSQAAALSFGPLQVQLQNALDVSIGAAGTEDITVLVLEDDDVDFTPLVPSVGATVTLKGVDPGSFFGVSGTTDVNGEVTFTGVAGPYSVTAQKDFTNVDGGTTTVTRVAGSVVDLSPAVAGSPPAGTIGVFLLPEFGTEPAQTVTVTGTVTGMPALGPGEYVEVALLASGGLVEYEQYVAVDPVTSTYTAFAPAGVVLDGYVAHRAFLGASRPVYRSRIYTGLGPTGPPFGTTVLNLDLASGVDWNQTVAITANNLGTPTNFGVQLLVSDGAGVDLDFSIYDAPTPPAAVLLPDLSGPAFAGFETTLEVDVEDDSSPVAERQEACGFLLASTPASATFDLIGPVSVDDPLPGGVVLVGDLVGYEVELQEGAVGTYGTNGVNIFNLAGTAVSSPPGVDEAVWSIFLASGDESFRIPPATLPMFEPNQAAFVGFDQLRIGGVPVGYASFFDGNLLANHLNLVTNNTGACESSVGQLLQYVP